MNDYLVEDIDTPCISLLETQLCMRTKIWSNKITTFWKNYDTIKILFQHITIFNNNNLVQYRLRRCWCATNTFIIFNNIFFNKVWKRLIKYGWNLINSKVNFGSYSVPNFWDLFWNIRVCIWLSGAKNLSDQLQFNPIILVAEKYSDR